MSHDESLHTYYSWLLYQGRGYQHTPLMHGPLQFHLIAVSYFLFGVSDSAARIPAALCGVIAVGIVWLFRRWLGRTGVLVAAGMLLLSPYMLYYSRYARNEAFVVVEGLLMFLAVFRYFETGERRWLWLLAASLALHAITKETSFIYTAQLLVFLGGFLAWQILHRPWERPGLRAAFLSGLICAASGAGVALLAYFRDRVPQAAARGETGSPLDPTAEIAASSGLSPVIGIAALVALVGASLIAASLLLAYGRRLRTEFPLLDLLVIAGALTLPLMGALPASMLGWDPLSYEDPVLITRTGIVVAILCVAAVGIGIAWERRTWLIAAGLFYVPFTVIYTTLFTNPVGFFSGLVGSLGYWIVQHGVERGSQPSYYYALVQLPIYEFLPVAGSIMAAAWAMLPRRIRAPNGAEAGLDIRSAGSRVFPAPLFLGYWAITSLGAFSFAGERMPWLTVHITLPMILLSGWSIGKLLEAIDWRSVWDRRGWLVLVLLAVSYLGIMRGFGYLLGSPAPFQGMGLTEVSATSGVVIGLGTGLLAIMLAFRLARGWPLSRILQLGGVVVLASLAVLTGRAAMRAAYLNGDSATEFLVYAHSAPGVKGVMRQVEDLSLRLTDGYSLDVAYDDDVSWPFIWYLREYPNAVYSGSAPSRDLLDHPVVIAGDDHWAVADGILGKRYHSFEYIRMWWPMQEYWGLNGARILNALGSPEYRAALWDIWLNRDFTRYGQVAGIDFSPTRWSPSDRMKLYVRKDVAGKVWDFGVLPTSAEAEEWVDPYEGKVVPRLANRILGAQGTEAGQFQTPRSVAVAPDGSLYVADTLNHRVQHLSAEGELLHIWGQFGSVEQQSAGPGAFNEPWGVAVAADGSVYVADTWNHRIQHFTAAGTFLNSFGVFGSATSATNLWGPRGLAVDKQGRLFVADTGNKRIVVVDDRGQALAEIGGQGSGLGLFDEPVAIAFDRSGRIYVTDTWNQRVQVFEEGEQNRFTPILEWPVEGWYGQSLENKPFIAVSGEGLACVTDPEGYRVLCFHSTGDFAGGWGAFGSGGSEFGLPVGLAFDAQDRLWVVDSVQHRLMRFTPALP